MNRRARLEGNRLLRWTLAFSALASLGACGAEAPGWGLAESDESSSMRTPEVLARGGDRSSSQMPVELRAAYIRSVQTDAPEVYGAAMVRPGEFHLTNPAQSFGGKVDPAGLELAPADAAWSLSLRTTAVGCDGATVLLDQPKLEAEGNRVRLVRSAIEEWYLNGPLGVEQGFVLDQAPTCAGEKVIQMQVGGDLRAELDDEDGDGQGEMIRFVRPDGTPKATMSHLYVRDAEGKRVPAWLSVNSGAISIHLDDAGATYPLDVDPLVAVIEAKIPTPDNQPNDQFGYGLAFSGNTVVVGVPKSDDFGTDSGAGYVFVRQSPGVWVQQGPKILPADGRPGQWFGFSVALSGDTAVFTAPFDNDGGFAAGAAYVFVRNGNVWSQQAKLRPADNVSGDVFGISGAIHIDRVVIGAHGADDTQNGYESGAAYSFTRSAGVWTQEQKLVAPDGEENELFGATVAVSAAAIGVGAVYDDDLGFHSGSMYMYGLNGPTWVQKQKLLAPNGAAGDLFSYWAAISSDKMIVSAALYDDGVPNSDYGAAFVYINIADSWVLEQKLVANDRKPGDWFGSHVAIENNSVMVGAQQTDEFGVDSGSAYWYNRTNGVWTLRHKLLPQPGAQGDRFGWTVGVSGNLAAVGAPFDDTKATDAGAVYIFTEKKTNGEPCTTNFECLSDICVDGVCCDTVCGGGAGNDCQACSVVAGGPVDGTCSAIAAGTSCRASLGACDAEETCNGVDLSCPTDRKVVAGTECRAAGGTCDIAERCDGVTNNCPADVNAPAGTVCRASAGSCDIAETCTGSSPTCPVDTTVAAGTVCRASAGACDAAEVCDGATGVCPNDRKVTGGTVCRDSAGACDAAEVCDGTTNACPTDEKTPAGTTCRASVGACDNPEACDGANNDCPVDTKLAMGTLCRASNGICDQPEVCDGTNDLCPTDNKSPTGTLCRAAAGICDLPETCDGTNDTCPTDTKPPAGTVCRASAGLCDVAETCDGTTNDCPDDGKVSSGQVCRLAKGLCDEFEFCDGVANDCPEDKKTSQGVFCRAPAGLCDEPEQCDGANDACPPDKLTPNGIVCRPTEGACDVSEVCNGQSVQCPADKLVAAGVVCRDSQGTCDIEEKCDGKDPECPDNQRVGAGIPCRASGGECDAIELCDGKTDNCPTDESVPDGTVCSIGTCEDGACTEEPPAKPRDLALYGGGPVCQANSGGTSSTAWPVAFLAMALASLRRRFRSAKP